jgi:nucleoside-diphosphate-sugar epimerase
VKLFQNLDDVKDAVAKVLRQPTGAMSEIGDFYDGKTLLLTGTTGFLGKVLLERILWMLPQVRRILLLIRPNSINDPAGSARLRAQREIFCSSIFNRLRTHHGEGFDAFVRDKVEIVAGDLTSPDLGLPTRCPQVFEEVDLIVNLAAIVGFDERLDYAIHSNTLGPYHLLNYAKRFRNPRMLHVSTAFVHGIRGGYVPEQILEPDTSPANQMGIGKDEPFRVEGEIERALRLAQSVEIESQTPSARSEFRHEAKAHLPSGRVPNPHELKLWAERKRQHWVGNTLSREGFSRARRYGWFDTYTFTKAMGEQLLVKSSNGENVIILRPSIIESSLMEPEPGWIEGFQTSTPILFGYGKGEIPDFPGKRDGFIDFIPVDFVVSAILAGLATGAEGKGPRVLHVASSSENPLRLEELMEYSREYFRRLPMRTETVLALQPWKYRSRHMFNWWLARSQQRLRIAIALNDSMNFGVGAARLSRKFSVKQAHLERLEHYSRLYADYTRLYCQFTTESTRRLFRSLSGLDQRKFFFDPSAIDWRKYIQEIHLPGVRRHVMKRSAAVAMKRFT